MDEDSNWYGNPAVSAVSDAEFAAQLQRQFDDEDLLSAQMSSSFNFMANRPNMTTAHSSNQNNTSNLKGDQEIAKRLQRKFYLDMKSQGLSDVDIASMLDSLTPDNKAVDQDIHQAIQASLGINDPAVDMDQSQPQNPQSFLEKFILTLYTNCRYEGDTKVAPHPNDDFSVFRQHASNSVKDLNSEMLISPEKIAELILNKVLVNAQEWDEFEAAFFIIDSVSTQMNSSDFNSINTRLIQHITTIIPTSNPLLLNATINLIGNLSRWLYSNSAATEACVTWLLQLPPYENLLPSISKTLERMAALMHRSLVHCFKPILDFLPYIELTTDHGSEMEDAALNLIQCCTHLINDKSPNELVVGLEALLTRPTHALNEISSGNVSSNETVSDGSWLKLASTPHLWLNRIMHIFKNLSVWQTQSEYLNTQFGAEYSIAPWTNLNQTVCQVICKVISTFSEDRDVIDECCQTCIQIINSGLSSNSAFLVSQVLNELLSLYQQHPQSYILKLAGQFVDEYTIGIDAEKQIASFLNAICIQTFDEYLNADQLKDNSALIRDLFAVVNSFTRFRITAFAEQPAAQILFEAAILCLAIEENEINKYAKSFICMLLQFPRTPTSSEMEPVAQNIESVMQSCIERILDTCLRIALYDSSAGLLTTVSQVLSEVLLFENQKVEEYLGPCIQRLVQSNSTSIEEIQMFETQLKASLSEEDVLRSLLLFSRTFRR